MAERDIYAMGQQKNGEVSSLQIEEAVTLILDHANRLTQPQRTDLLTILHEHAQMGDHSGEMDVQKEVAELLSMVQAMKRQVMPGGSLRSGMDTKDMKDVISSSNSLITTIMKFKADIDLEARMRAVERATVKALEDADETVKGKFFETFNRLLEDIS